MKDQLFLLQPGFRIDGRGPFYCADSVPVEGLLGFFPALRDRIDVQYVEHPRPRTEVVALLGDAHQSIPVLVLGDAPVVDGAATPLKHAHGRAFIDSEADIRQYLSSRYGVAEAS